MTENQHTEWKETWRDDHLRWVSGFANAEGGVLAIGRDNSGAVVGLADAERLLVELPNKIRDLLGVISEVNLLSEDGKDYLEVVTDAYPNPISYRGHYFQRSGSTLQELKGAALDRFLLRRYGRTWDGTPLPGVAMPDLAPTAIARFRSLATRSGRLDESALAAPDAELLEKLKLTEGTYLKRAAVLLFHPDPLRFVTGAFVKLGFFRSEAELVYHDEIVGDLFSQVHQTLDLLFTKYLKAAVTYEDIVRVERFPVPRAALREAVLNALVHRDYAATAPTQIRVYEDRLVMVNPAVLPEGWTQATLLAPHYSHPFNPDIANAFFRSGEIEAWGRGIARIFEACRREGAPEPEVRFEANGMWLEFPFDPEVLELVRLGASGKAEAVPEPGAERPGMSSENAGVSSENAGVLSENAGVSSESENVSAKTLEHVLVLLQARPEMTLATVAETLGQSSRTIQRYVKTLREQKRLRYVGPRKGGHWEVIS